MVVPNKMASYAEASGRPDSTCALYCGIVVLWNLGVFCALFFTRFFWTGREFLVHGVEPQRHMDPGVGPILLFATVGFRGCNVQDPTMNSEALMRDVADNAQVKASSLA